MSNACWYFSTATVADRVQGSIVRDTLRDLLRRGKSTQHSTELQLFPTEQETASGNTEATEKLAQSETKNTN